MGARQSVAQPPRTQQRTQSSAISNGLAPGPSTSSGQTGFSMGRAGPLISQSRTSRSLSAPVTGPSSASILNPRQQGNESSDSENEGAGPLIPSLEQLLSRPRTQQSTSGNTLLLRHPPSLPIAFRFFDIKCPVCNKTVPSDDAECHLVMCLTRPRLTYNEDVLTEEKGSECVICLEEMVQGDTIARLPCLCIYHKACIDSWFNVKNTCPEHPGDED